MSLEGKRILVTSGGTQEYIDDVRVLTNISSGKLGAMIARQVMQAGGVVHYVHGRNAMLPDEGWEHHRAGSRWKNHSAYRVFDLDHVLDGLYHPVEVRSAQDAYDEMEKLVPQMDAVIHCMAVSDFTFKRDKAVKCKSSDPEAFIEFMRQTITKNPKIIGKVKEWNPKTVLVGFKFEVGLTIPELTSLAEASIEHNGCDMVVANDKAEMEREKEHIAHFVFSEKWTNQDWMDRKVKGKADIATEIRAFLEGVL